MFAVPTYVSRNLPCHRLTRRPIPRLLYRYRYRPRPTGSAICHPILNCRQFWRIAAAKPKSIDLPALFARVQRSYPKRFQKDGWYLTTVRYVQLAMELTFVGALLIKETAALIASGKPTLVGPLYSYLALEHKTPAARQALVRRMREAMIKCIILNGIPIVMEAFVSLAAVERPEDREHGFTRQGWQADEKNHKRGLDVLNILYRDENDRIWGTFGAHRDIPWLSTDISYGLFLANHTILDIVESELVILPAIMCQNLKMATHWHLRGCLRVGISRDEVEEIQSIIHAIAEACGKDLNKIGSVSDVEDDH